jgi:molybdopterin/thiamine biosynthesis adenylyltransferase/rhodanese-related sulfurtransferase
MTMTRIKAFERFQRQVILKGMGESGQLKLQEAKVLVVGAGGLGCPVIQYLAAAGVGTIGIVDGDRVSASNLHRQVLYGVKDEGRLKAEISAIRVREMNPEAQVMAYPARLVQENCLEIIRDYDIVADCSDNFATRYMLNDACVLKGIPLAHASVSQFEGQVSLFNVRLPDGGISGHYRDLFPTPPMAGEVPDCAEAGVLGVLPGIIGSMQAMEVIKWITGIGDLLANRLLTYDALDNRFMELAYAHHASTAQHHPSHEAEFLNAHYELTCDTGNEGYILSSEQFDELKRQEPVQVIDVREAHEQPTLEEYNHIRMPLGELPTILYTLKPSTMVFFCQSGIRSVHAAKIAAEHFGPQVKVYSLQDGIHYFIHHPKQMEY